VGELEVDVWYGQDPSDQHWGCPLRERWGLETYQRMSPLLQEKLAFTVTATGTYAEAAAVARKWGCPVEDSTLHALAQKLGERAEQQMQKRLEGLPQEKRPLQPAGGLAVLMLDGWQVRERGPGWGRKKTQQSRVEWHELKTGVFYWQEQAGDTAGGRGVLTDKVVVSWQGEPLELGRRLNHEGMCRGLGRAPERLVVADGAPWIWNVAQDRWKGAVELLDFYHGSEHLGCLGEALYGSKEKAAPWVEEKRHQLRHGEEAKVLRTIQRLPVKRSKAGPIIQREKNYFASQAHRMNYQELADQGWPIGSGAVESACRQRQCRFKRSGQFWTERGLRNLCALEEARRNHHWDELWKLS
jgi:hypothetical protein